LDQWAAIDLGSNSFHLLIVDVDETGYTVVERLKEKVQLLAGASEGQLAEDAKRRGLACLERFAQRLSAVDTQRILMMGTFALRQALNAEDFLQAASDIVGVVPNVISGSEEARVIDAAVAYHEPFANRLVVDIGGGSTELCASGGQSFACSADVGCVSLTEAHLQGVSPALGFAPARSQALRTIEATLTQEGLDRASLSGIGADVRVIGTSGTIESVQAVLQANGWSQGVITRDGLAKLEQAMVEDQWTWDAGLPGLMLERLDIFPAGVAVLSAVFEMLDIREMKFVDVSLMHGMLCEAPLKEHFAAPAPVPALASAKENQPASTLPRLEISVARLIAQHALTQRQLEQARRVQRCATQLYRQLDVWWDEGAPVGGDPSQQQDVGAHEQLQEPLQLLQWACRLHEVGMRISAQHYHRHGSYIVKHADLPGFTDLQRQALALLIRGHRRGLPRLAFRALDPVFGRQLLRLLTTLRLAVILERSHHDADSPDPVVSVSDARFDLDCGAGWLDAHPLSYRELEVEAKQLRSVNILLHFT